MDEASAARPSIQDPLLGQVLDGRYRMLRRIGRGGMGVVYLAEHVLLHRKFAVKVLPYDLCNSEQGTERFLREARAAAAVGEQHVVDVTDVGELATGQRYIVLEYLEGMDLCERVRVEGPLQVPLVVELLMQLAEALGAVHEAGIVHRDLKPENLFVVKRGGRDFLKVLDFGVCKFNASESMAKLSTDTGSTLGTPNYMAPEQVHDAKHVDHRADIYALGAVGYFLLTGRAPFSGASLPALFLAICHDPIEPPHEVRADIPWALSQLLLRALARDPAQRFDNCAELREALLSLGPGASEWSGERTITLGRPSVPGRVPAAASPGHPRVPTVACDLGKEEVAPNTVLRTPTLRAESGEFDGGSTRGVARPARPAARALVVAAMAGLVGLGGAAAWARQTGPAAVIADVQAATKPSAPAAQEPSVVDVSLSFAEPDMGTGTGGAVAAHALPDPAREDPKPTPVRGTVARSAAPAVAAGRRGKGHVKRVRAKGPRAPDAPSVMAESGELTADVSAGSREASTPLSRGATGAPSTTGGEAEPVPATHGTAPQAYRLSSRKLQPVFVEGGR